MSMHPRTQSPLLEACAQAAARDAPIAAAHDNLLQTEPVEVARGTLAHEADRRRHHYARQLVHRVVAVLRQPGRRLRPARLSEHRRPRLGGWVL
eukprot:3636780-Prymnesium_polylepis.1